MPQNPKISGKMDPALTTKLLLARQLLEKHQPDSLTGLGSIELSKMPDQIYAEASMNPQSNAIKMNANPEKHQGIKDVANTLAHEAMHNKFTAGHYVPKTGIINDPFYQAGDAAAASLPSNEVKFWENLMENVGFPASSHTPTNVKPQTQLIMDLVSKRRKSGDR